MSEKILIISTSPRRGGSMERLCDVLEEEIRKNGKQAERLNVNDWNIHPCTGCDSCRESGECIQQDDMKVILEAMQAADAVVFASPIYFYNMSGQMKVVLDRTYPICGCAGFQKAAFIAACSDQDIRAFDTAAAGFEEYLCCLDEVKNGGEVLVPAACDCKKIPEDKLEAVRRLGREL